MFVIINQFHDRKNENKNKQHGIDLRSNLGRVLDGGDFFLQYEQQHEHVTVDNRLMNERAAECHPFSH